MLFLIGCYSFLVFVPFVLVFVVNLTVVVPIGVEIRLLLSLLFLKLLMYGVHDDPSVIVVALVIVLK